MEQNLIYIIGFIILTFIALIVSFSLKYEKRDYGGEDHHGHEYNHEHTESLPGFEKLRATVTNLTGDIKILQERALTSPITIVQLNNRFAYRKAADYKNASEDNYPYDPILLHQDTYYLSQRVYPYTNLRTAQLINFGGLAQAPSYDSNVPSYSVTTSGNTVTYTQDDENPRFKFFAIDDKKSALYNIIPEDTREYEVINKIEYFGITTGNYLPTPYYNNNILNTDASLNYIVYNNTTTSTMNKVPQVLDSTTHNIKIESMTLGLFAKVSTNPDPEIDPTDFTGFTAKTTNYKIIEYKNYSNNPITVNDTIYGGLTTDGTPYYLIYLVPIKNGVPSQINCVSAVKNVQVVVLLTGEVDENYVDTPTVLDRSSLTGIDPIDYTKNNQYYYIQGKDNIISMVFFKFNHTGKTSKYSVDIMTHEGDLPNVVNGDDHVYYINYYERYNYNNIEPESYLNYYYYNSGTYTWKVRKDGAWVDQDNLS